MPQETIRCTCGKTAFIMVPRRNGTATAFIEQGYRMGWRMRTGEWFCSEDCVAEAARDVTPGVPAIASE